MVQSTRRWRFGLPMVAAASLASIVLADFLFYDAVIGWTLGGFVAWLLVLLLLRNGRAVLRGKAWVWGWALTLMTAGLCVSLVIEPGTIAVVLSLILLSTLAMLVHGWSQRSLGWRWLWQLGWSWLLAFARPFRDSRLAKRWASRARAAGSRVARAARLAWAVAGVAIPLVLSLVFLGLFALANPVVADWMSRGTERVADFFANVTDYLTFSRIVLWYFAGFLCWGLLRHRPKRSSRIVRYGRNLIASVAPSDQGDPTNTDATHPIRLAADQKRATGHDAEREPDGIVLEKVSPSVSDETSRDDLWSLLAEKYTSLVVRCLIAMNAVFALQLVLDSRYLVLNLPLPEGMTHAEYAHRGAYPLIATAIFAATLVLFAFRPGGIAQLSRLAVWLVVIWIAQNIVLVASAAWRLQAYVEVYTLTRLRVAAGVWMLMVAGCLVLLLWRIARSRDNHWLTGWSMGWGIAVLWVCSFVPFDPMIAQYNVRNSEELGGTAGPIDLAYLERLGPDALPAVVYLLENLSDEAAATASSYEPQLRTVSYEPAYFDNGSLGTKLDAMRSRLLDDLNGQLDGWRGWTARRAWLEEEAWLTPPGTQADAPR